MITKAMKLLLILVYYGKQGISRAQLIEYLYGNEDMTDIANNLRVTIHRLKKVLEKAGLPESDYVEQREGRYYWSCPIKIETDVEKFKQLFQQAQTEADEMKKMLDAVYTGDGLSEHQKKVSENTKKRDLAIILTFLGTGIRVSECVGINLDDIDMENNKNTSQESCKIYDELKGYFPAEYDLTPDELEKYSGSIEWIDVCKR